MRSRDALVRLIVCSVAACAASGTGPSPTAARWQAEVTRVDVLLRDAAWEPANTAAKALVAELIRDLKGGPDGARLLATAYAQRAVSEAGRDEREGALWSLWIAGCLDPTFSATRFAEFGEAGTRLERWRDETPPRSAALALGSPGVAAPVLVESPTIVFRASAEVLRRFDRTLRVEVVVGEEGRTRLPEVRGSRDNPSPVAASLEALRLWRFEPARRTGRPVPVLLEIDLPLTRGAAERARAALDALRAGARRP